MSERIQVKRDGEHRGWVQYVGVDAIATDEGLHFRDEWRAERTSPEPKDGLRGSRLLSMFITKRFPSREEAIRWLVEEETA